MEFLRAESCYLSKDGCRLVWQGIDEDDQHVIVLVKKELDQLLGLLTKGAAGKVGLEDEFSTILVNTDTTQFQLKESKTFEVILNEQKIRVEEIMKYKEINKELIIFRIKLKNK